MRVQVGCEFLYQAEVATHAVVQVEPRLDGQVRALDERWTNEPQIGMSRYLDGFGNVCRRTTISPGASSLRYNALLELPETPDPECLDAAELAPPDLPDDALVFTLPSRYCPSQELANDAWDLFGSTPPGWGRVQTICDWVHSEVRFGYLDTSPLATALDVFKSRAGVCRDFAHLAVTFCRALNIPARYVFGYLPDIRRSPRHRTDGLLRLDRGVPRRGVVDVRSPQQPTTGRSRPDRAGSRRARCRHDLDLRWARAHVHDRVGRRGDLSTARSAENHEIVTTLDPPRSDEVDILSSMPQGLGKAS
jgi:hypothetical protein